MEDARLTNNTNTLILGDFNAKSHLWSRNRTEATGTYLESYMATLNYIALNN